MATTVPFQCLAISDLFMPINTTILSGYVLFCSGMYFMSNHLTSGMKTHLFLFALERRIRFYAAHLSLNILFSSLVYFKHIKLDTSNL